MDRLFQVVSKYSYVVGTKEKIDSLLQFGQSLDGLETDVNADAVLEAEKSNIEDAWNILFDDCVKALEACIEGDLKHYHKARFRLAQALFPVIELMIKRRQRRSWDFVSNRIDHFSL